MSLRDALEKAGLKPTQSENFRKRKPKKEKTKSEKFQETRIFCEACETTQQDVEKYHHNMPMLDAKWLCVNCADKNSVHDEKRVTAQSHAAKNRTFLRFYGPTVDLAAKERTPEKKNPRFNKKNTHRGKKPRQADGNRAPKKQNYKIDDDGEKNFNC